MRTGDRRARVVALAFALLALTLTGAAVAFAANGTAARSENAVEDHPEPEGVFAPQSPEGVEIESARTETSDTFQLPGGERERRIYQAPINEEVGPGEWEPIEPDFEPGPGASLVSDAGAVEAQLPDELGEGSVRLSTGSAWVATKLLGVDSGPADVEEATASYELNGSGASVELSSLPNGIKEIVELPGPSAPSSYRYELTASSGVGPKLADDGSVVFRGRGGKAVAELPTPTVSDASENFGEAPGAINYKLEPHGVASWIVTVETSREWLEDSNRAWPVRIDPSLLTPTSSYDCTIYSWLPESNRCSSGGYPSVYVEAQYKTAGADRYGRTLELFGSGLPPKTSEVQSASLNLYSPSAAFSTKGLQLQAGEERWNNYVSWKFSGYPDGCDKCNPWKKVPGAAYLVSEGPAGAIKGEVTTASRGGSAPGWWTVPVNQELVQKWVSGIENTGVVLEQLGEQEHVCAPSCLSRKVEFESAAAAAPEVRPYLAITFIPRSSASSKLSSPTEGTTTARRLKLQATWEQAGIEGATFQWREGKKGPFQTITPGLVQNAEGNPVSWPVAPEEKAKQTAPVYFDAAHASPTLRKKGGIVQVRALFNGPGPNSSISAPIETIVNRSTGGPRDVTAPVGPGSVDLLTGNFTTAATDVSIPTYNSSLGFTRSYSSRGGNPKPNEKEEKMPVDPKRSVLGPGWTPGVALEEAGGSQWKNLKITEEKGSEVVEVGEEAFETFEWSYSYATLTTLDGDEIAFEKRPDGTFSAPPEVTGWTLVGEGGGLVLSDPGGTRTTFTDLGGTGEYVPTAVSQAGSNTARTARVEYELPEAGRKRISMIVAPSAPGASCTSPTEATQNPGCRALVFSYAPATSWGAPAEYGQRLSTVTFFAGGIANKLDVAKYEYNAEGRLVAEWDPRLAASALKTTYSYGSDGALKTITPPGQEPWTLEYGNYDEEEGVGRLTAVKRPSLLASPTTAQTSIAYEVPVSGTGSPYAMGGSSVAQWGQKDVPVDATAIFPPDQVPTAKPPATYSHAALYYVDSDGYGVNVATPSPTGSGASISTNETDEYGNVVRELTPKNRDAVMAEPETQRPARAAQLDTQRIFGGKGTQMEVEMGPLHRVKLDSGASELARLRRVVEYDQRPEGVSLPSPDPHLPTRETSGAWIGGSLKDAKITETQYDWTLRKPSNEITVMEGERPRIETITVYNDTTGLPVERRQPASAKGGSAGTTKFVYNGTGSGPGCESPVYWGLLCKVEPAAQPSASEAPGQPKLLAKQIQSYNGMSEPLEVTESPGGEAANVRRTLTTYDPIGRPLTTKVEGAGAPIPKTQTLYDPGTGAPTTQQFVKVAETDPTRPTTMTYNKIGQIIKYEDADGGKAEFTYDIDGRLKIVVDTKGSQTFSYAEASGVLTKLEDSAAGSFTAVYDADGNLTDRALPNGLTARTTFNEADEPTKLSYTKASSCGEGCTWFEESLERSVQGQIRDQASSLSHNEYVYDKDDRLEEARETPTGATCTSRKYTFDLDSNRKSKTTRIAAIGASCPASGGSTQNYSYDAGDRLQGTGLTYDAWGRISELPAELAGGKPLTTSYYANDALASQAQSGVMNSYELDASLRPRQRLQTGGVGGTEVFHYDGPGDSSAWYSLGASWSRNIVGIGGELSAVQNSGSGVTFEITNLHGDAVATASPNATATKLLTTSRFDEFGAPLSGSAGRYGWLGGKKRRTELASGVVQMGARSYIPSLGRFLTPDPVREGSANPYDYVNQDPVNAFDLRGEKLCGQVHGYQRCANSPQGLERRLNQARRMYRNQAAAASRAAAAQAHHHPVIVFSCGCETASQQSGFESFVGGIAAGAVSFTTSAAGDVEAVVPYQAASDAFKYAQAWNPEHLVQAWQCGWAIGEGGGQWKAQCDPLEVVLGQPPSSAR